MDTYSEQRSLKVGVTGGNFLLERSQWMIVGRVVVYRQVGTGVGRSFEALLLGDNRLSVRLRREPGSRPV